jgi:PAS domain S-box-containing protein
MSAEDDKRTEERLRESEAHYRAVVDSLAEALVVRNRDGAIIAANRSVERLFGAPPETFIGRHLLHPDFKWFKEDGAPLDDAERPSTRALNEGMPNVNMALRLVRPDGVELWLSVRAQPVFLSGKPDPVAAVVSYEDITDRYVAEQTLRESESRYRAVIESLGEALIIRDRDFNILACNRAAEELFMLPRAQIIGSHGMAPLIEIIGESGEPLPREKWPSMRALREGRPQRDEVLGMVRRDGSIAWVIAHSRPMFRHGESRPFAVVGSLLDITLRREAETRLRDAEETNRRLLLALQQSSDAIYAKDRNALITSWNAGAERMFGYTAAEAMGKSMRELHLRHLGDADFEQVLTEIRSGQAYELERVHMTKSGKPITVSIVTSPLFDSRGRAVGEISTSRDITELRSNQHVIEQLNRDLELRVAQRTAELEAALAEIESFSYSVSHDLRAPLRAIDGFSQILVDNKSAELGEEGRSHLGRIRAQVGRMAKLIDDLLNLSRVSRAEFRRANIDVSALAETLLQELAAADTARRVRWTVQAGIVAQADPGLARIMFHNLIGNAWKFTSKQNAAVVEVGTADTPRGHAIYVRDNGAGFDMEYSEKLFGAFQRLHSDREYPGTGIGLATVKRILMRHGGKCWAEARPGEGATFYLTLP